MDDDGFFGFDSTLPPVRVGPQQEFGDVELEDTYDALNDETFGVLNGDDDWEEAHEKLAEYLGCETKENIPSIKPVLGVSTPEDEDECAYPGPEPRNLRNARIDDITGNVEFEVENEDAAHVAATVSQLILDDDDIESIISRPMNYSRTMECKLFGRTSPPSSLFDSDAVGSPSRPSIWSTQLSDIRKTSAQTKIPPQELSISSPSNGNSSDAASHHPNMTNLMQQHKQSMFKTVEDLERDFLQNQPKPGMTMEELERKILSNSQVSLPRGTLLSMEEVEAGLTGDNHSSPVCRIPPPPQQLQPPHLPSPYMQMPPPMGMNVPPPMRMPMTAAQLHMPMGGMCLSGGPILLPAQGNVQWGMPLPHHRPPPSNASAQRMAAAVDESRSDRNQNQRSHANTSSADESNTDDDSYTGLMSTKEKQWLMSIQINQLISDNPYVDDYYFTVLRLRFLGKLQQGNDGTRAKSPKLLINLPERAKMETRTYAPTQFANSLGKLQVVTYTAPRRIIDVGNAAQQTTPSSETVTPFQDPLLTFKETRKFKQILLDIEKMYLILLELEDAEMRINSLPEDSEVGQHHQAVVDYQLKLQSFLCTGDRLQQIMLVRKGKVLILRAWGRLTSQNQELIVRTILVHCLILVRRDTNDHLLVRFLPLVNEVFASVVDLQRLVSMAQLIDPTQKNSGHPGCVTSSKMGFDVISLLMCRGSELLPKCVDEVTRTQWFNFVYNVGNAVVASPTPLQTDLRLLTVDLFQAAGMEENKLKALENILTNLQA